MTIAAKHATAEELLAMPESKWFELYEGELKAVSPANFEHGRIAVQIAMLLQQVVKPAGLGQVLVECGFVLQRKPDTVLGPDISFVSKARLPSRLEKSKFFEGHPDLAVEIISPTNSRREIVEKIETYLNHGTKLAWLVDPVALTVDVYRPHETVEQLSKSQIVFGDPVIPGFACQVVEFFA